MRKPFAITSLITAAKLTFPLIAFAAIGNICDVLDLVDTAANWFAFFIFVFAIIAILYAAFLFLTAGGNEETSKKARSVLIYGLIGIAVALLATQAVDFVKATVGSDLERSCPGAEPAGPPIIP